MKSLSETVSARLPKQLIELMTREAEAKGVSLGALLRSIIEDRYGFRSGEAQEPFIVKLEKALKVLGEKKLKACSMRENCPFKAFGLEPSDVVCGICPIHNHSAGFIQTTTYNPLG